MINILTRIFGSRNERLLKQYAQLRKIMKQFKGMEGKLGKMKLPGFPTLRG